MGREIERKFLVFPERLPALREGCRFVQGYLCEKPQIRFRIVDGDVILCVKEFVSRGERVELEFSRADMGAEDVGDLIGMALWPPLVKVRYRFPVDELVWEVDVYEGRNAGLITAEVELPAIDHPVRFPDWVNGGAELTGDSRYANIALTARPYRDWGEGVSVGR